MKTHTYTCRFEWKGNLGEGTKSYAAYSRAYMIDIKGKVPIEGSSDPKFRGDSTKHNPEDLFLSSICSCHALWYFHLCASNGIVIVAYEDNPHGTMTERKSGSGQFSEVILEPQVRIQNASNIGLALRLHDEANKMCFIANSCNFPILHQPYVFV